MLAALAAGASWASVRQTARIARAARYPHLVVQVLLTKSDGRLNASIYNAGTGTAVGVAFVIARDGQYASNYLGDGILRPDEKVFLTTDIVVRDPTDASATVVPMGRDRDSRPHSWTHLEKHKMHMKRGSWRQRWRLEPDYAGDLLIRFSEWFPESDLNDYRSVSCQSAVRQ